MSQRVLALFASVFAFTSIAATDVDDPALREEWVKKALSAGGQLIDESSAADPLDRVRQQWIQNALERGKRIDDLRERLDAAKGKPLPSQLKGEMVLFGAYSAFLNPKLQNIVMKRDDKGLACHLWFNTENGEVDIVYGYDTSGKLLLFRIDRLPEGVSAYMPAGKSGSDYVVLWFQKPDISIVLSRTDPFAGFVQGD
jgi:hypothetical protein